MNLLTDDEICTAYIEAANQTLRPQDERIALGFARAIIAATVAKLAAGVSVEPDVMTYDHGDHRLPLYSHSTKQFTTAIAAAQAQAPDCGCIGPRECTGACCEAAVEPVAYMDADDDIIHTKEKSDRFAYTHRYTIPLYTSPPDHTKAMRLALEVLVHGGTRANTLTAVAALRKELK